jgi:hypothetical protein
VSYAPAPETTAPATTQTAPATSGSK